MEDFVREGACGLIAYTARLRPPFNGWDRSDSVQAAMHAAHEEIRSTGRLRVPPQPQQMARDRIQPRGFWASPREIPGLVPAWYIIGPFDDPQRARLGAMHAPDSVRDLDATYRGTRGAVRWLLRRSQAGYVGLSALYGGDRSVVDAVAYAACTVVSPAEQDVQMRFGSDDDAAVSIDGREVWRHEGERGVRRDEDVVPVHLRAGQTRVLAKVANRSGQWGFFVRFTDSDGRPLDGLTFLPRADAT